MAETPEIYFHVGLGKVASTYLQQRFFPKLKNIRYIPSNRYRSSKSIIRRSAAKKFLVSREFDRQLEREVRDFLKDFPQTRIIILFRRHDSWIASQYKRYVKNGYYHPFNTFFDLKEDCGFWKKQDLELFPKVELLEKITSRPPLVLFYDDLKQDPWSVLDRICAFSGSIYDRGQISLAPVHRSFSDKQLRVLRAFCARYVRKVPRGHRNRWKNWLLFRPWWAFFHVILYVSSILPESWTPTDQLISAEELTAIRRAYGKDWDRLRSYAEASKKLPMDDSVEV